MTESKAETTSDLIAIEREFTAMPDKLSSKTIRQIVECFAMERHPTAGWFAQHYSDSELLGRPKVSSIYYLLAGDEPVAMHKSDAIEVWHYYAGAPAEFTIEGSSQLVMTCTLGTDIDMGQRPQIAVPAYVWQTFRSLGDWTLLGCTASPGFSLHSTFVVDAAN